eukprot:1402349-Amphidinium_carterae.2
MALDCQHFSPPVASVSCVFLCYDIGKKSRPHIEEELLCCKGKRAAREQCGERRFEMILLPAQSTTHYNKPDMVLSCGHNARLSISASTTLQAMNPRQRRD